MRDSSASASGISDLPMQILIGACIIAFAAPIFYSAYDDISSNVTENRIEEELNVLLETMELVLAGDFGTTIEINLDLKGFGSVSIDKISIGGPLDDSPERFVLSYALSNGYGKKFTLDPPYPIVSSENSTLELNSGSFDLKVTNERNEMENHILVELL